MAESVFVKPSDIARSFFIDWRKNLVQSWGRERRFNVADIVRAPVGTGFYYKCNEAGVSGGVIPVFPVDVTAQLQDGSVLWDVFHPDSAGLFTITSSVWTVDAGITHVGDSIAGFLAQIDTDDGVAGEQYRAVNDIVLSTGEESQDSMVICVEDPEPV